MFYYQKFENEKISSQIVGFRKDCYQNGGRVSKNEEVAIFALSVYVNYE